MFHWKDGWYFERVKDGPHEPGTVHIVKREDSKQFSKVIQEAYIPPDEWCSIIASVSPQGETGETYREAQKFHKG